MINMLKGFVAGLVMGWVLLLLLAWNRHIVRTPEGHLLVPRGAGGFEDIYVDVRDWGPIDYLRNQDFTEALARHGYEGAKKSAQVKVDEVLDQAEQKVDAAKKKINDLLGRSEK
jgi:hypothetical protein